MPLPSITRRIRAIDARDGRAVAATADVDPIYRVGDQLHVQPDARLANCFAPEQAILMTGQEIAVARSHIEVWKTVANGRAGFSLILEDDVSRVLNLPSSRSDRLSLSGCLSKLMRKIVLMRSSPAPNAAMRERGNSAITASRIRNPSRRASPETFWRFKLLSELRWSEWVYVAPIPFVFSVRELPSSLRDALPIE